MLNSLLVSIPTTEYRRFIFEDCVFNECVAILTIQLYADTITVKTKTFEVVITTPN